MSLKLLVPAIRLVPSELGDERTQPCGAGCRWVWRAARHSGRPGIAGGQAGRRRRSPLKRAAGVGLAGSLEASGPAPRELSLARVGCAEFAKDRATLGV